MDDKIRERYVKVLRNYINSEIKEDDIMELNMEELGIDSFKSIQLLIDLEVEFDVEFTDSMLSMELFVSARSLYDGLNQIL
ncbi:MAG: hypothetical protein K2M60_09220 [Lachnospiraceae bacterium]|nr:hypothetical protein [Lachnospiraceae bacterium]MDE6252902.1 hypothetical protein [Lachnospiraceae bacterium]